MKLGLVFTVQLSFEGFQWERKGSSKDSPGFAADEVTRDYAHGETDRLIRKCVLLPWLPAELLDVSCFTPEPPDEHYQV